MNRRLALTPAIGLFTGLSVVSFGAVSMWLTGVHGSPANAKNACSSNKTDIHTTTAVHTAVGRSGSHAGHVARLPILLDAAARTISGPAAYHSASRAAASTTSPPLPSSSPHPSTPAPPTPNPSPGGGNVTPSSSPSSTPNPGSSGNVTGNGNQSPTVAPGGTNSTPTPTATPTPTKTATPTPTNTTTTPPPSATLCMNVETLGSSNTVDPGTTVHFGIWVWLTSGNNGSVKIDVDAAPNKVNPSFIVCDPKGGTKCTVSGLKAGKRAETQVKLRAFKDMAGRDITLTVTATSKQAGNSATATDKIEVIKPKKHHSSPTPTPTYNPYAGYGNSYPGGTNPYSSGVSNPYGNLGSALPPVSPSPGISPSTAAGQQQQQHQHQTEVTDLSAGLPLDVRLIGGQVIGLAILAAAITIAVARLSLRKQPAKHSEDSTGSTPAS
jgi:hypothetical protein